MQDNYLEELGDELALALGHAIWTFSKIEWLTYKYMRKLSSEPLDVLMGNQPFGSRISLLKQLVERIEGMAEQKKLALQLIESANKLAKDRNTIVHNPWQIWIDLEKSDFRTEIQRYSDPNKAFDLSAIKQFTENAQKTASELEFALNTLVFRFDRLS